MQRDRATIKPSIGKVLDASSGLVVSGKIVVDFAAVLASFRMRDPSVSFATLVTDALVFCR